MPQIITHNPLTVQDNWQKQLANAISKPETLLELLDLPPSEFVDDLPARKLFPMRVPLSFVKKMKVGDPRDPLLLQVLPLQAEFTQVAGFSTDPLGEQTSAVPGLLHKYQSRVLLIVRGGCAINCRYCFRRHFPYQENSPNKAGWADALQYIAEDSRINEVVLSGGDPLMANDRHLAELIKALEQIPHLKRLRIHSRLPVVIPERITPELVELLENCRLQCILVTHINHPNEIDEALTKRLALLRQAGVQLLNQSVLLRAVNDNSQTLIQLSEKLFTAQVLPYYLFLLDKVEGAAHFDVSEAEAVALMQDLYSSLPGYLVPKLTREEAGKSSKTAINVTL